MPLHVLFLILSVIVVGVLAVYVFSSSSQSDSSGLAYYRERVEFALNPTADRAFEFGMRHFNAGVNPAAYNLGHAEYFLKAALSIDPSYPYANQQVARILFLKGNFSAAIPYINQEISVQGDRNPSAYYIRGLIRGYQGAYRGAAEDFEHYIQLNPTVWAAYNDHAWTIMKTGDYAKAVEVLLTGLERFPSNAWILNSFAIALYETGDTAGAHAAALRARDAVEKLTPQDWSDANPGNDPRIAGEGFDTFRNAALRNLERISLGASKASLEVFR